LKPSSFRIFSMNSEYHSRLLDCGWTIHCERAIEVDIAGDGKTVQRYSTLRATKGDDQIVVRARLGREETALLELYQEAKALDPDLQQVAMLAGSGEWVIDLSQVKAGNSLK
jgi:hypothetical protein